MPDKRNEPQKGAPSADKAPSDLQNASAQLTSKIAEARSRGDMPLDSTLGNPAWDKNAADGHLDLPDDDDDAEPPSPAGADKAPPR
jgi:hypothetical protein